MYSAVMGYRNHNLWKDQALAECVGEASVTNSEACEGDFILTRTPREPE